MPDQTVLSGLTTRISEIKSELEKNASGNTEFSTKNIDLPEYDEEAIEMLFGKPTDPDPELFQKLSLDPVKAVCSFNKVYEEKLGGIIGAAQILLNDYNELVEFMKKNAIQ